jgi:hypothetical protein
MTPTNLTEFGFYLAILAAGGFLYFVGNLIFGFQNSGGKRLITFVCGAIGGLFSYGICWLAYREFNSIDWQTACLLAIGVFFGIFSIYSIFMSFFGSREKIDKIFEGITNCF